MKTLIKVGTVLMNGGAPDITATVTAIDKAAKTATLEWADKAGTVQTMPLDQAQAMASGAQMKRFHDSQAAKAAAAEAERQDDLDRYGEDPDDELNP